MKSIYRLWMMSLVSPLIYLVICLVVNRWVFAKHTIAGFWPLREKTYHAVFVVLASLAAAALPVVFLLKSKWASKAAATPGEDESPMENARGRRFVVTFMICDTVAFCGLVLFLIQGQMTAMLFFGVLGLLNYAMAHPGQPARESDER